VLDTPRGRSGFDNRAMIPAGKDCFWLDAGPRVEGQCRIYVGNAVFKHISSLRDKRNRCAIPSEGRHVASSWQRLNPKPRIRDKRQAVVVAKHLHRSLNWLISAYAIAMPDLAPIQSVPTRG
jgi:hypothetical protein